MGKNLKGKTVFIIAILVIFIYGIFYGRDLPSGSPVQSLKNGNIHLGLDLQGGTHLVLQVKVAEALNSTTDRDVQALSEALASTGATASKPDPTAHPEVIQISGGSPTQQSAIHDVITGNEYAGYDVTTAPNGGSLMTMKQEAIRDLEARTLQNTIETIRDRVDSLGVAEPVIQQYGLGDNQILVELPGMSDLSRVEDDYPVDGEAGDSCGAAGGPYPDEQPALASMAERCLRMRSWCKGPMGNGRTGQRVPAEARVDCGGHGFPRSASWDGPERADGHQLHADE